MGTTIEIYDIYQLGNHILDELSKFVESVEEVTEQVDAFCGLLSEQDGAAVVSMKNYMSRYAGAVDMVAQSLYCAYGQILPIYEAAMSSLDADEFAVINMECVEEVIHAYITASVWLDGEVEIVNDICRKTAGFCDADKPEETGLYDNLDELVERERRFRSEAIEIDHASCEGEIQMLADLCDYCGDYLWSMYEHRYVPCGDNTTHIDLLQNMNLLTSLMQIQMYSEANADRMDAVMEVCQHYTEVYIRSDRNEAGWNKAGAGLKLIETGLIALLSREIAVSKFMTKTDEILGTVTMLFGITEGAEGIQDITFSALGKLDTQSLNVLKSLLGEKNYYRMMKVCEVGATAASLLTDLEAVHKENLIRSGGMETEATGIKTMDDSTGIKPAELSEGIPEEIKSVQMPELPKNTGVRAAATGQVENEAGVAATGLVENNTVPGLKSVDNKLPEGIRTQIAETEIPRAKAVGENISGRNPLERKTTKIEPVRTKPVNEILPNGTVTGEMSGGKTVESGSISNIFKAPEITRNGKGELTNGTYILNQQDMQIHVDGKNLDKSQFLYNVDANKAVLDAAAYADVNNLWEAGSGNLTDFANKAKVPVINGYVGVTGKGELTSYINVYRTKVGYIHGCPGNP